MKIYIDSNYHCLVSNTNGDFREVETDFFVGKCQTFVEGFCYDDSNEQVAIYAWKSYDELEAAQREYERQLLAEYESALAESVRLSDLDAAYQEGVNAAYDR